MKQKLNKLATLGLAIGAIFGISGSIFTNPVLQIISYQISSIGLIVACALLAVKYFRKNKDFIAVGFLLFAIGESVMSSGAAAGIIEGQAAFGAGTALYVPALLLVSIPIGFPIWTRITGTLTTIPFIMVTAIIFSGGQVLSTSVIASLGYGMLVITIIGWILTLTRKKRLASALTELA